MDNINSNECDSSNNITENHMEKTTLENIMEKVDLFAGHFFPIVAINKNGKENNNLSTLNLAAGIMPINRGGDIVLKK